MKSSESNHLMETTQKEILNTRSRNQGLLLIGCFLLAATVLLLDYLSGPLIRFPILYLVPITLVAWLAHLNWGLVSALAMPLVHLSFTRFWVTPFRFVDAAINTCILIIVFVSFAYLVNKVAVQKRELEKEVQTLRGILPICSFCKKIRNQDGIWVTSQKIWGNVKKSLD
jgi:hypothetical protein